jgi:hypothetical protein
MSVQCTSTQSNFFCVETEVRGIPDEQLLLQFGFWPEDTFNKIISVIERVLR